MKYADTDIVAEVCKARENLLVKYGGIEGLHQHMAEERPRLEKQGWKFVTLEEVLAEKEAATPLTKA
jgi:hypothetical protein